MNELDVDGSGSWGAWREIDRSEVMTPIEGYLLSYSAATADARMLRCYGQRCVSR